MGKLLHDLGAAVVKNCERDDPEHTERGKAEQPGTPQTSPPGRRRMRPQETTLSFTNP